MNGALARIMLRYGVGALVGTQIGNALAGDPDLVLILALGVGAATEWAYKIAKRKGWSL